MKQDKGTKVKFLVETQAGVGKGSVLYVKDRYAKRLINNNEAQAAKEDEPVKFVKVIPLPMDSVEFDSSTQKKGEVVDFAIETKKQEEAKKADKKKNARVA